MQNRNKVIVQHGPLFVRASLFLFYSYESFCQAEFMEHDERPLLIDIRLLGDLAEKVSCL